MGPAWKAKRNFVVYSPEKKKERKKNQPKGLMRIGVTTLIKETIWGTEGMISIMSREGTAQAGL